MKIFLFLLLIFLLPTQLGRHFWPEWSLVNGVRIDYLAPTIYVADILTVILTVIFFFNKNQKSKIKNQNYISKIKNIKQLIFVLLLIIFFYANQSLLSFLKTLKIIEIIIFVWLVKSYIRKNKKNFSHLITVLSLSMLFQSLLAIAQFINHGSLNGIFYFFGERNFTGTTPGIANATINGELILRPYGTFPHPNVLAAYLLICILIILNSKFPARPAGGEARNSKQIPMIKIKNTKLIFNIIIKQFNNLAIMVSSFALFLTLSRVTIVLWVGVMVLMLIRRERSRPFPCPASGGTMGGSRAAPTIIAVIILGVVACIIIFLFPRFSSLFSEDKESWQSRLSQSRVAIAMWRDHPWRGVGLNQYLPNLPKYQKVSSWKEYQPVHNTWLLILAEMGLFGFLLVSFLFLKFLIFNFVFLNKFQIIICILILSLFDHYFYTLQQGNLMIGLILGLL